jgi:hypothetical protein
VFGKAPSFPVQFTAQPALQLAAPFKLSRKVLQASRFNLARKILAAHFAVNTNRRETLCKIVHACEKIPRQILFDNSY